jgi:hypothetical protein
LTEREKQHLAAEVAEEVQLKEAAEEAPSDAPAVLSEVASAAPQPGEPVTAMLATPSARSCFLVLVTVPFFVHLLCAAVLAGSWIGYEFHRYPIAVPSAVATLTAQVTAGLLISVLPVTCLWIFIVWKWTSALWKHSGGTSGISPRKAVALSVIANPSTPAAFIMLEVWFVQFLWAYVRAQPAGNLQLESAALIASMLGVFVAVNGGFGLAVWGGWYILSRLGRYVQSVSGRRVPWVALLAPVLLCVPGWWIFWNMSLEGIVGMIAVCVLCFIGAFRLLFTMRDRINAVLTNAPAPARKVVRRIDVPAAMKSLLPQVGAMFTAFALFAGAFYFATANTAVPDSMRAHWASFHGDNKQAVEHMNNALKRDPRRAMSYVARGDFRRATDPVGASEDYTKALILEPIDAARVGHAQTYIDLGNAEAALKDADEAERLGAAPLAVAEIRADAYKLSGDEPNARKWKEQVAKLKSRR